MDNRTDISNSNSPFLAGSPFGSESVEQHNKSEGNAGPESSGSISDVVQGFGHRISSDIPENKGAKRSTEIFEQTDVSGHTSSSAKGELSISVGRVNTLNKGVDDLTFESQPQQVQAEKLNSAMSTVLLNGEKSTGLQFGKVDPASSRIPKGKSEVGGSQQRASPKPLPRLKGITDVSKGKSEVGGSQQRASPKPLPRLRGTTDASKRKSEVSESQMSESRPLARAHKITNGCPINEKSVQTGYKLDVLRSQITTEPVNGTELGSSVDAVKQMNESAERPLLQRASTDDPGKEIYQKWSDSKGNVAEETINRTDTVDNLQNSATKELTYLKKELGSCRDEGKKAKIEGKIHQLEKIVAKCKQGGVSWANSDYFRDILRGNSDLRSSSNPDGIQGAVQEFSRLMDEEYYSRAPPVNMRYHQCEVQGGTEYGGTTDGWVRVGIISCMDNGFVNQNSMRELQQSLNDGQHYKATYLRNTMTRKIMNTWQKELKNDNKNMDASAGYALTQLGYSLDQVASIADIVHEGGEFFDVPNEILTISEQNITQVGDIVNQVTEKRNQLMSNQFLQIIMEQLEHASPEELANGELRMLHVGLLNHESRSVDGTGWYHNEEQEMQDMANIFDQFDQAKLICDGNGPYVDLDGNIHLPQMDQLPDGVQQLNLRAIYLNQSVQGHTKNDGTQKKLNDSAIKKLQSMGIDDEVESRLEERLTDVKSGYTSAADTVQYSMQAGFRVSTGCLSAKDRTGFVSALVTKRKMEDNGFPETTIKKTMRKQINSKSPAVKVIKDNTGTSIMKITPFKIEGLTKSDGTVRNFFKRSVVYANQGVEILKERRRIARYEKHGKPPSENTQSAPAA